MNTTDIKNSIPLLQDLYWWMQGYREAKEYASINDAHIYTISLVIKIFKEVLNEQGEA